MDQIYNKAFKLFQKCEIFQVKIHCSQKYWELFKKTQKLFVYLCHKDCFFYFRSKKLDPQPQLTRVFGIDLNELVVSTGKDVPDVLVQCTTFIEKHGLVDGVYRISGISSNIKRLK